MVTISTNDGKIHTIVTESEDHSDTHDDPTPPCLKGSESRDEEDCHSNDATLQKTERDAASETYDGISTMLQLPSLSTSIDQGRLRHSCSSRPCKTPPSNWPHRSPPSGRYSVQEDESSFNLLTHCLDNMSDNYLHEMHQRAVGHCTPRNRDIHGRKMSHNLDVDIVVPAFSLIGTTGDDVSPLKDSLEPLPFYEGSPQEWLLSPLPLLPTPTTQHTSNPFNVLGSCRQAFEGCTFQLTYVYDSRPFPVNLSKSGSFQRYKGRCSDDFDHFDPEDFVIAQRRVKAAICAFGGNSIIRPFPMNDRNVIFRTRRQDRSPEEVYEEQLHHRYFFNGNRISWEVEEYPPVHTEVDEPNPARLRRDDQEGKRTNFHFPVDSLIIPETTPNDNGRAGCIPSLSELASSNGMELTKMKYHCKLCGQPKMNHVCPFRQSVQRSIGIQVYPTANPFAANEPGALAPTLSDMNNIVIRDGPAGGEFDDCDDAFSQTLLEFDYSMESIPRLCDGKASCESRKRSHDEMNEKTATAIVVVPQGPFADIVEVHAEQYRAVSPLSSQPRGAYQYPPVALTFNERKKLSDTLFVMTQGIHQLSLDCASLLRDARERNLWDLAVAELLTQVVVALRCDEGDMCLDGLQQYLVHLGIAC